MTENLLTVQQAADILGISTKTLRRWDKAGILVPLRTSGKQRRYFKEQVDELKKPKARRLQGETLQPRHMPSFSPENIAHPQVIKASSKPSKPRKKTVKNRQQNLENLLTVQEAANIVGVSTKTLRRWDKSRLLVPLRTAGKQRRYLKEQVEKLRKPKEEVVSQSQDYKPFFATETQEVFEPIPTPASRIKITRTSLFLKRFGFNPISFGIIASSLSLLLVLVGVGIIAKIGFERFHSDIGLKETTNEVEFEPFPGQGLVLGESTESDAFKFSVSIPSLFSEPGEFAKTLKAAGIATLSGGLKTENADIDAGIGKLTASNVLYSVIAGSGISLTGDEQNPTITNTAVGVLSIGGKTGDVKLSAGSGITISDVTITNSGVTSLTGTSSQITVSGSTGSITLSLPQSIAKGSSPTFAGLTLSDLTSNGGPLYTNGAGTLAQVTAGSSTQCLLGGTAPTFGSCTTGITTDVFWNQSSGALFANNSTVDLLIGGQATTSAKFAVLNINSGTPTASISANSGNNALFMTGAGVIQTTNAQTLTLGGSTTGNIILNPLNGSGTVGIGTTSPSTSQKLHVEGQCVTGDSILVAEDGRRIRVDEVKKGQKVYTLDQETGQLAPAQINALLDMGVKPVFKLTTKSGKSIRTTGNHPYLVNLKAQISKLKAVVEGSPIKGAAWVKVADLKVGDEIAVADSAFGGFSVRTENNKTQSESNNNQSIGNSSQQINFYKVHNDLLLNRYPNINDSIPQKISTVNNKNFDEGSIPGNTGDAIATPNQNTEKLIRKSATTESKTESKRPISNNFNIENDSFQWDTIVSIEYVGEEQVWDLAIEGTHNFVANGIVAHNTYINGNLGIGNTTPLTALDVTGSASLSANLSLRGAGTAHTFNILDNGTLNFQRSPGGDAGTTTALFIQNNGDIGISTTTPVAFLDLAPDAITSNTIKASFYSQTSTRTITSNISGGIYAFNRFDANNINSSSAVTVTNAANVYIGGSIGLPGSATITNNYALWVDDGVSRFDGNVGIGNTTPLTALDVTGSASLSANLSLRGAGTAHTFNILDNGTLNFQRSPGGDAGVTNVMYLGSNGNVGIGTTSPLETLDVRGTATVSGNLVLAGAARTIQTTALNSLTIGGSTTGNIILSGASNVGNAVRITDGTTAYLTLDTRTTNAGSIGWILTSPTPTITSAAGASYVPFAFSSPNLTFTGTTQVTTEQEFVTITGPSIIDLSAITIDKAANVHIYGPPGRGGSATITDSYGLHISGGGGSGVTRAYGLYVDAPTGATNNYAAVFATGNVGIGNTTPLAALDVTGSASLSANLNLRGAGTAHTFNILDNGTLNFQRSPGGDAGVTNVLYLGSNGNVGLGTTSPLELLDVRGSATVSGNLVLAGAARTIQTTANNLLTIGGNTTGNITISPQDGGANGILNLNTTTLQIAGTAGSTLGSASCVTTTDGIVTGSGSCPASGSSNWTVANGTIRPNQATVLDLLIGGDATSSAKFAVLNINSGTPTASVSAGVAGGAYLNATGTLATTAMQTLALGGSTTGNITVDSGTSSITLSDDTTISGDLAVNGATSADITSTTTTGTLFNSTVTTLSLGGAATTLNLGTTDSVTRTINLGTGTGADTINIGTGATTANTINLGTGAVANTIAIGSSSTTTLSLTDDNWSVSAAGVSLMSLGSVTAPSYSFTGDTNTGMWSSAADTLNFSTGGTEAVRIDSSQRVGVNATSPLATLDVRANLGTLPVASISGATSFAALVVDNSGVGDIFTASSSGNTQFVIRNNGAVGIGAVSIPLAQLDVRGSATVSGNLVLAGAARTIQTTANNLLTIGGNTTGNITISPQDGGANGILNLNTTTLQIAGTAGSTVSTASCVTTTDGIVTGSGSCPAGGVPNMNSFTDTTATTIVDADTTNYWDGTIPNITPSASTSEILVMMTAFIDGTSATDTQIAARIFRNTGGTDPVCQTTGVSVGGVLGSFQGANLPGAPTITAVIVDAPATTSIVEYILCSEADSEGAAGTVARIDFTLYEINDAADLAEVYGTFDGSIGPGDVVSLDPTMKAGVKKSRGSYDRNLLGVVSTKPSLLMGGVEDEGAYPVPLAFSGRVPVRVNTENGPIQKGDTLTSSSTPGVSMKAIKAGPILGVAMGDFDPSTGSGQVGTVMMFVKTGYFNGSNLADVLKTDQATRNKEELSKLVLKQFIKQRDPTTASGQGSIDLSEILTDRLAAGLEVITPKVTTDVLAANVIKPSTNSDLVLNLTSDGKFVVKDDKNEEAIRFDNKGNAFFKGEIAADKIKANTIEGLEIFTDKISSLSSLYDLLIGEIAGISTSSATIATSSAELSNSGLQIKDLENLATQVKDLSSRVDLLTSSASTSALFSQSFSTDFKDAETLNIKDATVSGRLLALGRTTLSDLGVTGSVSMGVISIRGLDGEINTLGGPLKLQSDGLDGIDILNGKIIITRDGTLSVKGTVTAKTVEAEEFKVLGTKTVGSATLLAGKKFIDVSAPVASESSKIFITPTSLTAKQLVVTSKENGQFRVEVVEADNVSIKFDWWIVNN